MCKHRRITHKLNKKSTLTLNCQSQQLSSALSTACDFKSHFCKQFGPRSDCSSRGLISVHTVCQCAKMGLKSLQEYSADDIQTAFSDVGFLGILRVNFVSDPSTFFTMIKSTNTSLCCFS